MVEVTMRLALLVIARAAFAVPMAWKDADNKDVAPLANGHTMTSSEALHIVSTTTLARVLVPKVCLNTFISSPRDDPRLTFRFPLVPSQFVYRLPTPWRAKLSKIDTAFKELDSHMLELIQERRDLEKRVRDGTESAPEKEDLFGSLVRAAGEEREDDGIPFSDREVVGNTCELGRSSHWVSTAGGKLTFSPTSVVCSHLLAVSPTYRSLPMPPEHHLKTSKTFLNTL